MAASPSFQRIGIVGQARDPGLERVARILDAHARSHGIELCPEPELGDLFSSPGDFVPGRMDLLVSLGGDGTLLRGARLVAVHHTPVLGINIGHLGFLTSIRAEEVEPALEDLVRGDFWLDVRFTLEARVLGRNGKEGTRYVALNDAVLHKGGFARVIQLAVYVGEEREEVGAYAADGIIVATPTGSTAYSLSAGGAIVAPSMECLLTTPISPHTLAVRPLILPADTRIEVEIRTPDAEVVLTIDGQAGEALVNGDRLVIHRGRATVPLVRFSGQSFFTTLRRKLHWGAGATNRFGLTCEDEDDPEESPSGPTGY